MEWWLPLAVLGAAMFVSMLTPQFERRAPVDEPADVDAEPPEAGFGPAASQAVPSRTAARRRDVMKAVGASDARAEPETAARPISTSYVRDPENLDDWPQAPVVTELMQAFTDRWGADEKAASSVFRRVEPFGSNGEQAFAFVIDPEGRGKETSVIARACITSPDAERPSRLWVTKYFDHMGERFREDVSKTPQYSRGIIAVRDVPPDASGRGSVALDYMASLGGDPYDDIHPDDVGQFRNLINIMRMFA